MFGVYADTSAGKKIRQQIQQGTLPEKEWKKIPDRVRGVLRCAEACKSKLTGMQMTAEMYGNTFTSQITLQELDKFIARCKKNTAPGVSGIRIDHIAALPDDMREAVAKILSVPYISGLKYTDWNEEILNWVPKEEGNPDINKRRPPCTTR